MQVLIGGIDRSADIDRSSFSISDAVNQRSVANFRMEDSADQPEVGQEIEIYDGEELIFGGSVDEPENEDLPGGVISYSVSCVDHHEKADRHLVAEVYENQLAGDIVKDLRTKYLDGEGITAGTIQDGPTIKKAVFNYIPVSQCLDELSEITGLQWLIRPDKSLDFFDRSTFTAPFTIDDMTPVNNFRVRRHRQEYRNRQYLRAGQDITTVQTRTFKGDGETQVFTVDLPLAKVPTVKVNGVTKIVGIRGVETGKDWYWQKGDKTISQDSAGTKLTSSDTLTVEFQGFYPLIIVAEDPEAINERVIIEGGTGIYEAIEEKASLDTRDAALDYTNGLLRRYARIGKVVTFNTSEPGLKAGMLLFVTRTDHGVNGQMLISRVTITDPGRADGKLSYAIEALDGEAVGGWVNFFKKLVQSGKTFVIRENEILVKLLTFRDSFSVPMMEDELSYILHQYWICGQEVTEGFILPWQQLTQVITCSEERII